MRSGLEVAAWTGNLIESVLSLKGLGLGLVVESRLVRLMEGLGLLRKDAVRCMQAEEDGFPPLDLVGDEHNSVMDPSPLNGLLSN
jgi:hypothetical protein